MNKVVGAALIVVGTSIGAGMLALPVITASCGFLQSSFLLIAVWIIMLLGALRMAEVSLCLHENNNIISMSQHTLGSLGKAVAWVTYLGLLYALLSAYISGGSGVLQSFLHLTSFSLSKQTTALLFTLFLSVIVYHGVHSVDRMNRLFLMIKFTAFFVVIFLLIPHVNVMQLSQCHSHALWAVVTVVVTSFGFAGNVPTLCSYLSYDMRLIRYAIIGGSFLTLVIYLLWMAVVQGVVHMSVLMRIAQDGVATEGLTRALSHAVGSVWMISFVHLFTAVCMLTSFICVSLGLSDFLADGLKLQQKKHKPYVHMLTFSPPLLLVLFYPEIFITALSWAGVFCLIILLLIPCLMAWRRQGAKKLGVRLLIERLLLSALIMISMILILVALIQKIG